MTSGSPRPAGTGSTRSGRSVVSAAEQPVGSTRTLQTVRDAGGLVTSKVRRTVLPGGLRVVTERVPGVRSVALGVWIGVGSRHEQRSLHGGSHFLEHLLFKGTRERSAMDISVALDTVGGEFNAFTAKDHTCFHARVLDEDLALAVDVLGDMITDSVITPDDVEAERDVILDEIAMHEDDPDDVVHNLLSSLAWGDTPLGRPIAGTDASIAALTREQIVRFYRHHYRPEKLVVAAAGNLDHSQVVRLVRKSFARNGFLAGAARPPAPAVEGRQRRMKVGATTADRPLEQVNLVVAFNGLTRRDPRRYALGVLNATLGGGTSSRLFQEVRERRGLAYSVYSFASHHDDSGLVGVSAGCLPARVDAVLDTVRAELDRLTAHGITAEELRRGQGQLRGGLLLGLEDTGSRMARLGKSELVYRELLTIDEVLARIDAVTLEEVQLLARQVFTGREALAIVGPGVG